MPLLVLLLSLAIATGSKSVDAKQSNEEALETLIQQIDTERIGDFIRNMSEWPRNTQSPWMKEKEKTVKTMFREFGMDVVTKKYQVIQCFPKEVDPSVTYLLDANNTVVEMYREDGDEAKRILPAFNAYSDSGTVEGEPVYLNYGRKKDFEKLVDMGINLTEKIGIARYGKLYRGDKAKFAKEFGLAGLIIYMDGADYAPEGVKVMPDGPGLPDTGIQRGTLKDADGDPSTYLYPSSKYAYHASEEEYKKMLPGIITMPINFKNALPLLRDLAGDEVLNSTTDPDENWQGAGSEDVPVYRYGPGFKTDSQFKKLRITVNLEYKLVEIENIFGVIKGSQEPDRWIMVGNHRDTWVNGAVDATTGLAALNELGHGLMLLKNSGWRPRRTIVFASWGAEEQGIIGSTEFVEDYITLLQEKMVAYINIDVAASGQMAFKPAATPNFRPLLERAAKRAQASHTTYDGQSFYDQWKNVSAPDADEPVLKTLGSGSDYASFIGQAGVSSIDLTVVGAYHTYHTEYDNYDYLSKYADPGMKATRSVSEVGAVLLMELAGERLVPLSATSYSNFIADTIKSGSLKSDLETQGIGFGMFSKALDLFVRNAEHYEKQRGRFEDKSRFTAMDLRRFNDKMLIMERSFIVPQGLPGRPHKRHMLFAPSLLDSYSGSIFPGLYDAVTIAKKSGLKEDWNAVHKQLTIATWVITAAGRALAAEPFPR